MSAAGLGTSFRGFRLVAGGLRTRAPFMAGRPVRRAYRIPGGASRQVRLAGAFTFLALAAACTPSGPGLADRVFVNASVLTMDSTRPRATAVAIRGERIVAVGRRAEVEAWIGPDTRVTDLEGRTVIPGLNETHIHVRDLGFERNTAVNLTPARNVEDVQRLLGERLAQLEAEGRLCCWPYPEADGGERSGPGGEAGAVGEGGTAGEGAGAGGEAAGDAQGPWLFGLGWTQDRLDGSRMADRHDLDAVSREVPISLDRIYRGLAVNTRVFELLGYDFDDPSTWPDWFREDPADFGPGEIILRDSAGIPNGVFLGERAPRLVSGAVPEKSLERRVESLLGGMEYLASLGITALVEAGSRMGEVTRVYQEAYRMRGGRLPVRAVVYDGWYRSGDPDGLGDPAAIRARVEALGFSALGDDFFRVRGAKSSMDGGMGSRSAAVSVPYLPVPEDPLGAENRGALREPDADRALAQYRALADHGWEIHTHAIGDRAIRRVVDVYRVLLDSLRDARPDREHRWSIIHLYQPHEPGNSVVEEMAELGIVAAVNPANLYWEGESFLRNVGPERMARHTPYRTLLEAGVVMASGSDYPNNPPDPWVGIYQMTTRRIQDHEAVYGGEQTLPLVDALRTFTLNGARLTYDEDERGSLEPGKYADLVVLDADLEAATEEEVLGMADRVLLTLVGGEETYRREGFGG